MSNSLDADGGGWQEAVEVKAGGGEHFQHEGAFKQDSLAVTGVPMGEGRVAHLAIEEVIQSA